MRVEKDPKDGTFRRFWLEATHAHIDRTCSRMWRPSKRLRQRIHDTGATGDALVELYTRCFPDKVVATENSQASDGNGRDPQSSDGQGAGRWEILLPNLVTFVYRGKAADGEPATEIKYLKPGSALAKTAPASARSSPRASRVNACGRPTLAPGGIHAGRTCGGASLASLPTAAMTQLKFLIPVGVLCAAGVLSQQVVLSKPELARPTAIAPLRQIPLDDIVPCRQREMLPRRDVL
jgi:hypothetical protein